MKEIRRTDLNAATLNALGQVEGVLPRSHCPHSGLRVAAGLLLTDGTVVLGVNYESASYGLTLCAERTALARAQSEGRILETAALVLSAAWSDRAKTAIPITPCGACRQWLAELSSRLGKPFPVYSFWQQSERGSLDYPDKLLPDAFI